MLRNRVGRGMSGAGLLAAVAIAVAALTMPAGAITYPAPAMPAAVQASGLKPVSDPEHRFTIAMPAGWNVLTQTKNPSVVGTSPNPSGQLPDSVNVVVYDMPNAISAEDCIHESDLVLRYAIHTWTNVSQGPVTVGGKPAYSRVYDWKSGGSSRRSIQTCVTEGHRVFMVVGTTENTPAKVSAELPVFQRVTATLRPNAAALPAKEPTRAGGKN